MTFFVRVCCVPPEHRENQTLKERNKTLEEERLQLERNCQRLQLRCEALEQQVRDKDQVWMPTIRV